MSALILFAAAALAAAPAGVRLPRPAAGPTSGTGGAPPIRNISYDGRAMLIDGERRLLAAGSIHYTRSTPEMWPGLMRAAKAAGIDVITTYVFWNVHEASHDPATGHITYDFSTGRLNLAGFLQQAQAAGLFVFVRLGPFTCAEWTYGGIPTRLRAVGSNYTGPGSSAPRMTFRSWDPAWRREMSTFLTRTMQEIRPFLAGNGGPVIMLQPENEYGNIEQYYGSDGERYAQWAADLVQGMDVDVPIAMCQQQGVTGVIETCNGFYCDPNEDADYPSIFTEAWSGWFQARDGSPGHRPASDLAYAIAKFVAEGGTMFNYYMLQGGTNFGRTAGAGIATSYDYDAPISEWGIAREPKYSLLQKLHAALHRYEKAIVENQPVRWWSQGVAGMPGLSAHPYGAGLIFYVNANTTVNYTLQANCSSGGGGGTATVPLWSVTMFDCQSGTVVFNSAHSAASRAGSVSEPGAVDQVGRVGAPSASWEYYPEATNLSWCREGSQVVQQLPEHTTATGGPLVTDYLYAAAELPADAGGAVLTAMPSPLVGGPLGGLERVDGFVDGVWFEIAPGYPGKLPSPAARPPTASVLLLRMATGGLPNYLWSNSLCKKGECDGPWDSHLENFDRGLLGPILLNSSSGADGGGGGGNPPRLIANLTHANWTVCPGLEGEALGLSRPNPPGRGGAVAWRAGSETLQGTGNWVRLHLPLPPLACSDLSTGIALNLTGMAVGEAWVNGHSLGRYSLRKLGPEKDCTVCNRTGPFDPNGECHTRCGDFAEPLYHAPRGWLEGPCSTAAEGSTATTTLQHVILWEATSGGADPSKVAFVVVTES